MVCEDALLEYERRKRNDLFFTIKNTISGDTVTVLIYNGRSLLRDADNIVSDNRILNLQKQINPSDSTCKIIEMLNFSNISFDHN